MNTATPLAITTFERICVDNAFSTYKMIKAAKAYSVKNQATKTHKYRSESITSTRMTTADDAREFVIFSPTMECQVRALTDKSLIISALFLTSYNDGAKALEKNGHDVI